MKPNTNFDSKFSITIQEYFHADIHAAGEDEGTASVRRHHHLVQQGHGLDQRVHMLAIL